jgi:hypothetical protein
MEFEPSNAVLLEKISALSGVVHGYQEQNVKDHSEIITRQKWTNGKVAEIEISRQRLWGGFVVLSMLVVPIAIALITEYLKK